MRTRRLIAVPAILAVAVVPALPAAAAPANAAPDISGIHVSEPTAKSGAVTIHIMAVDPDGDPLRVRARTSSDGTVRVDGDILTYTPTAVARHAAAREGAPLSVRTATVIVHVSDPRGARASKRITVPISPRNRVPSARAVIGQVDPSTGRVIVTIRATDADGDRLRHSAPSATFKGIIRARTSRSAVSSAEGSFTYTPTAAAREAAGAPGATQGVTQDTFTVTVSDGHGGTVDVPVTVPIAP